MKTRNGTVELKKPCGENPQHLSMYVENYGGSGVRFLACAVLTPAQALRLAAQLQRWALKVKP